MEKTNQFYEVRFEEQHMKRSVKWSGPSPTLVRPSLSMNALLIGGDGSLF